MTWYVKKHICSFRNGPPSQKKMIPPPLEAENIIIYIKDKYSNKHLKPLATISSTLPLISLAIVALWKHNAQHRSKWKSFWSSNPRICLWSIIPHLAITVQPPGTEKMGSRMKKRFLKTTWRSTGGWVEGMNSGWLYSSSVVDWRFIQPLFRPIFPSHVAQVALVSFHTVDGPKFLQC